MLRLTCHRECHIIAVAHSAVVQRQSKLWRMAKRSHDVPACALGSVLVLCEVKTAWRPCPFSAMISQFDILSFRNRSYPCRRTLISDGRKVHTASWSSRKSFPLCICTCYRRFCVCLLREAISCSYPRPTRIDTYHSLPDVCCV